MLRYTVLWCKASFDILNRVDVAHECDGRTDRQTDFAAANATLHYVVRPKIKKKYWLYCHGHIALLCNLVRKKEMLLAVELTDIKSFNKVSRVSTTFSHSINLLSHPTGCTHPWMITFVTSLTHSINSATLTRCCSTERHSSVTWRIPHERRWQLCTRERSQVLSSRTNQYNCYSTLPSQPAAPPY